jgi:hypothetical protein
VASAAQYLGLSEAELAKRAHGHSLAELANATAGRSANGLIDALVASRRATIEAARRDGRISATVERSALASLRGRVTKDVRRKRP